MFSVNTRTSIPIYAQLAAHYKHAIMHNHITPNTKLPSIRTQAQTLNLSTTTIEKAYQQLLLEGFIESIPKSGYYTVDIPVPTKASQPQHVLKTPKDSPKNSGQVASSFDNERYRRCMNDIYLHEPALYTPAKPYGEEALQKAITRHTFKERGIKASAAQVVVAAGIQNLLILLKKAFSEKTVAYLNPRFERALSMLEFLNFKTQSAQTVQEIIKLKPTLIYIAPSNHYPTGDVLPIKDRMALIDYAKTHNAYIIEDDYNHIFRYNAYQIPSLYTLAKGQNVIHVGTFSRHLLISMRISYMIIPPALHDVLIKQAPEFTQTVSKAEQLTLAKYMQEGYYDQHLKRMSKWSKKQNDLVQSSLKTTSLFAPLTFSGLNSNTHILVHCQTKETSEIILARAKAHHYATKTFDTLKNTILIPYSGLDLNEIPKMITSLFA